MAHMTDAERKQIILTTVAPVLKKYGIKGSLSIRGRLRNCVVLTLLSGSIDFQKDFVGTLPKSITSIRNNNFIDYNFIRRSRKFLLLLAQALILDSTTEAVNKAHKWDNYYSIQFGVEGKEYKFIKKC